LLGYLTLLYGLINICNVGLNRPIVCTANTAFSDLILKMKKQNILIWLNIFQSSRQTSKLLL